MSSRTVEQLDTARQLTAAAPGYRVVADEFGWPVSPGRYGRLEHLGAGQFAAFTDRRLIRGRLLAIPGVTRHQVGDDELRVLLAPSAIPAVAGVLRCHRKRSGGAEHLIKHAYKATPSPVLATTGAKVKPFRPPSPQKAPEADTRAPR